MSESTNSGISGVQNINAQNIAVGPNSRIEVTASTQSFTQSLEPQLAELGRAIEAFDGSPEAREALSTTHAEVVKELDASRPDKGRVLAKLAALKDLAGPAVPVVQAAAALAQAVAVIV